MQITVKLRLRDKHAAELNRRAWVVNGIWNCCDEAQQHVRRCDRWLSYRDLARLTAGASIKSSTSTLILCSASAMSTSLAGLSKRKLGCVGVAASFSGESLSAGYRSTLVASPSRERRLRSAACDARRCICVTSSSPASRSTPAASTNVPIEVECATEAAVTRIGIDLGLKSLATLSGERQIEIPRFYRKSEAMLPNVQRAKKPPTRTRSIHAKIANRRKDFLHKESRKISTNTGLSSLATPGRRNWPRPA
jgi:putative transposase